MTGMMGTCYATMFGRFTDQENDRLVKAMGGADTARQVLCGERVIRTMLRNPDAGTTVGGILEEPDYLIDVPGTQRFIVREMFRENRDGEVRIASIDGDSKEFLDIVEECVHPALLKSSRLTERSLDAHILYAVDGIGRAKSHPAHIYFFLRDEAHVSECYTFFIEVGDKPFSLHVWHDAGWIIEIQEVPHSRTLEENDRIVTPAQLSGPTAKLHERR